MGIRTEVVEAKSILEAATAFYDDCDRKTFIDPNDTLIVAYIDKELVGIARLCSESGSYTLRTVQVHYNHQRKGIGQILLKKFAEVVSERKIEKVFCMPYDYLESFYGTVGFKKIESAQAPDFLQTRFRYFRSRNAGKHAILMERRS